MHVKILLPCGHSAPDMTFGLIHIQNLSGFFRQRRIDVGQPVRHIFVYRRFRNSELLCCLTYCGIILNNVSGDFYRSFFYISFQGITPVNLFIKLYAGYFLFSTRKIKTPGKKLPGSDLQPIFYK